MPLGGVEKNQIGCYVSLNSRLQDMMFLSDSDYIIKVPISSKSSEDDKIQIVFKNLSGGEEEEIIGTFNFY